MDSCNNTCCSLNNDRCILECTDLNNCSSIPCDADLLQIDPIIDPSDILPCDIEIPQFPVKIIVNDLEDLPPLDELPLPKDLSHDELQNVMLDIEDTVNFNSTEEGLDALDNPDIIFSRIQTAFNTFKEKTGRQMTYNEMRQMMG
jgi:hypothetical protein